MLERDLTDLDADGTLSATSDARALADLGAVLAISPHLAAGLVGDALWRSPHGRIITVDPTGTTPAFPAA